MLHGNGQFTAKHRISITMSPSFLFDIDHYLNPVVPRNRVHILPEPISHFLGYRSTTEKPAGSIVVWVLSFIGALCGILVVEAVYHTSILHHDGAPIVIGSLVRLFSSIPVPGERRGIQLTDFINREPPQS